MSVDVPLVSVALLFQIYRKIIKWKADLSEVWYGIIIIRYLPMSVGFVGMEDN